MMKVWNIVLIASDLLPLALQRPHPLQHHPF